MQAAPHNVFVLRSSMATMHSTWQRERYSAIEATDLCTACIRPTMCKKPRCNKHCVSGMHASCASCMPSMQPGIRDRQLFMPQTAHGVHPHTLLLLPSTLAAHNPRTRPWTGAMRNHVCEMTQQLLAAVHMQLTRMGPSTPYSGCSSAVEVLLPAALTCLLPACCCS